MTLLTMFPERFSASMLADLHRCELYWFRAYCQRLVSNGVNPDLQAGGYFASACELVRKAHYHDNLSMEEAINLGVEFIENSQTIKHQVKTNSTLAYVFKKYFQTFPLDGALTPAVLTNGERAIEYAYLFDTGIPHPELDCNIQITGKIDSILERIHNGKVVDRYITDEKTTGSIFRVKGTKEIDIQKEESLYSTEGQFICLTPEHEVLTRDGWVSIKALPKHKEVMCWEDGHVFWDTPIDYIEKEFIGDLIGYEGQVNILGTPEHRQVVYNRKFKKYQTYTLDTLPGHKDKYQFITSGSLIDDGMNEQIDLSFLQLLVASQADGCWTKDSKHHTLQFTFSKQRKIDRLETILHSLGIAYTKNQIASDYYSTGSYTNFRILDRRTNDRVFSYIGQAKKFGSWLLGWDKSCLLAFIHELQFWDGSFRQGRIAYYSSDKDNVTWVQTVASLTGLLGNIQEGGNNKRNKNHKVNYIIYITNRIHKAISRHAKGKTHYEGKVYCITVPSSYFMVRYKGTIMVTGNCYHWAARQLGLKTKATLIRKVPILANYEPAFELTIPINDFMIEQWSISTFNRIAELAEKYKYYKEHKLDSPHKIFDPVYQNVGCFAYYRPCQYMEGCKSQYGEQLLNATHKQLMTGSTMPKAIPLQEYRTSKGL